MSFIIRNCKPHEYDMIRLWGNSEKFDRGNYDFEAFKILDKKTWWIGELDGEPIASLGLVQYDQTFGFVGLYYVKPQHRGKGYGLQIWNKAFQHVTALNIGLECASIQASKKYEASGFKIFDNTFIFLAKGTGKPYFSEFLVDCRNLDFNQLVEYDQQHFPGDRKAFLQKWIDLPESQATAFFRNGKIQGYGVIRVSDHGHRIGPLFADSYGVAEQIFKSLKGSVHEEKRIRLDVPSKNGQGEKLGENNMMMKVWTSIRMYTREQPFKKIENVFGLTSLQMG